MCSTFLLRVLSQEVPIGYNLIWSDEFDLNGVPNSKNWIFEEGFVRNQELQWYQNENAWCEDGYLIIEGRKETKPNPDYRAGSSDWRKARKEINYTSSCVKTKGLQAFQYGIIDVRAKIITKAGLWPAIWTLGVDGKWPSNGECDILEYYDDMILANFAWPSGTRFDPIWNSVKLKMDLFEDPEFDQKFHLWRLIWTEDYMEILLDGVQLNRLDLNQLSDGLEGKNPFRQPHYILLNLAIGSNGGDPSLTEFPSRYLIDYVRVYQKTGD